MNDRADADAHTGACVLAPMSRAHGLNIRMAERADLEVFMVYLAAQLADNGRNGQPRFQPVDTTRAEDLEALAAGFDDGMARGITQPGWRRLWIAVDTSGRIQGHIDLRAHAHALTSHRCLLGMGVDKGFRRRGLGGALIAHALDWVTQQSGLSWVDLRVLSANLPAIALYQRVGFQRLGETPDMFRIGDESLGWLSMTLRMGSGCAGHAGG